MKVKDTYSAVVQQFISLKRSLLQEDLALVKADKGESLVVMEQSQYEKKMKKFLKDAGAKKIRSPFTSHNEDVRAAISNARFVITKNHESVKVMNPSTPRLLVRLSFINPISP